MSAEELPWVYWIWENGWRCLARYASQTEARRAARNAADPPGTYAVCREGSSGDLARRLSPHVRRVTS